MTIGKYYLVDAGYTNGPADRDSIADGVFSDILYMHHLQINIYIYIYIYDFRDGSFVLTIIHIYLFYL